MEEVPAEIMPPTNTVQLEPEGCSTPQKASKGSDPRVPALKVDASQVWVYQIRAAKFESDRHSVSRNRTKAHGSTEASF